MPEGILSERQRRRRFNRRLGSVFGIVAGLLVGALGAAATVAVAGVIAMAVAREEPKLVAIVAIFSFLLVVTLLLCFLGGKIVRDALRALRDRTLDGLDLDREPWLANPEWRARRIVHRITAVAALRILQGVGIAVLLSIAAYGILTVSAGILATALAITAGILLALGLLYRALTAAGVEIQPRTFLPLLFILPPLVVLPVALGIVPPEASRVLEVTGVSLMVSTGLGILAYLLMKERRFGDSVFHLRTLPAYVGEALEGEIEVAFPKVTTGLPVLPEGPVVLELLNITPMGRSVRTNWRTETAVPIQELTRPGDGTLRIPVRVPIPGGIEGQIPPNTFWTGSSWKLEARAAFPGVDYAAWFIVPVFFPEGVTPRGKS